VKWHAFWCPVDVVNFIEFVRSFAGAAVIVANGAVPVK